MANFEELNGELNTYPDSIMPNMNPGAVSKLLRTVGVDREGQDIVFQGILDHSEQLIYDLSTTFSRSMSIQQAEKGYNSDRIYLPQINLALLELDAIKSDLVNTFSKQQWDGQLGQENSWQKSLYPLTDSALPSTNPQYDVFK